MDSVKCRNCENEFDKDGGHIVYDEVNENYLCVVCMADGYEITCPNCGCITKETFFRNCSGDVVCTNCSDLSFVECNLCGNLIAEDYTEYDECEEVHICVNCISDHNLVYCNSCNGFYEDSKMTLINEGLCSEEWYCRDCVADEINRDIFHCQSCNDYFTTNHRVNCQDGDICEFCADNHYRYCGSCGSLVYEEDGCYDDYDDEWYCYSCQENSQEGRVIYSYDFNPEVSFYGSSDLYLGVELEIDRGNNKYDCADDLISKYPEIYCKEDGSLGEYGFEIVTQPCTLDYHMNDLNWKKIRSTVRSYNYVSHNTSTCGLHVHTCKKFFGTTKMERDLNLAKLILLINKFWDSHIVPFSRRDLSSLQRWAKKVPMDIPNGNESEDVLLSSMEDVIRRYDRYSAINIINPHTVEFRIFKGTLKVDTILATLQFVDTICRFVKSMPLEDYATVTWDDIFKGVDYKELREYNERLFGTSESGETVSQTECRQEAE